LILVADTSNSECGWILVDVSSPYICTGKA